ncbi:TPA: hypothetical protein OT925_001139 [Enterococcus faecalis]|nr:hypothetical protein [Enterococcus faecalis]
MIDDQIKTLTEELIQRGTTYDLDFLENVYDDSLKFTRVLPDESVEVLSKEENIRFFQSLKKVKCGTAKYQTSYFVCR